MECLPCTQEKFSTTWPILSFTTYGPLFEFPQAVKPPANPATPGTPQLSGLVSVTGKPSAASTFVTPPNSWPRVLPNVVNPAWNSFTLVGDRTTILETIYCCEVVDRLVPCSGNDGVSVVSLVQPKRPNHCKRGF